MQKTLENVASERLLLALGFVALRANLEKRSVCEPSSVLGASIFVGTIAGDTKRGQGRGGRGRSGPLWFTLRHVGGPLWVPFGHVGDPLGGFGARLLSYKGGWMAG